MYVDKFIFAECEEIFEDILDNVGGKVARQYNTIQCQYLFCIISSLYLPCLPSFLVCSFFLTKKVWSPLLYQITKYDSVIWSLGGGISISHYILIFLLIFLPGCQYLEKLLHIFCWLVLVLVKMTIYGVK